MSPVSFLLNVLWIVLGGFEMALGWAIAGIIMAITIVGLPWTPACFRIASFSLFPFGRAVVDREEATGHEDAGTGPMGLVGNILWFVFAGWWLALGHLLAAVACFITIIGIPFGVQHLKLAGLSLAPIGKSVIIVE